jgi:hypothetical protein
VRGTLAWAALLGSHQGEDALFSGQAQLRGGAWRSRPQLCALSSVLCPGERCVDVCGLALSEDCPVHTVCWKCLLSVHSALSSWWKPQASCYLFSKVREEYM